MPYSRKLLSDSHCFAVIISPKYVKTTVTDTNHVAQYQTHSRNSFTTWAR